MSIGLWLILVSMYIFIDYCIPWGIVLFYHYKKKGNKEQLLIPVPDFNTPQDKIMPSTEMLLNINKKWLKITSSKENRTKLMWIKLHNYQNTLSV